MPDVDLSSIFTHFSTAGAEGDSAPLLTLLNSAAGVTITPDPTLNTQLKQGTVTAISVFQPNACTADGTHGTTGGVGGAGGTGQGSIPPHEPGPGVAPGSGTQELYAPPAGGGVAYVAPTGSKIALPLREKLLSLGTTFNELVALLDRPDAFAAGAAGAAPPPQSPQCWRYRNTTHGPTGLFCSREVLRVKVSGFVETLGGLKQASLGTDWLMYMEYSVNTYLAGQAAWDPDPVTRQPRPNPPVVLTAANGCLGMGSDGLMACGTDSVSDVLRVIVNFKKIFIADVNTAASGVVVAGGLSVHVANMQEQSFAGVFPFTHRMGATS